MDIENTCGTSCSECGALDRMVDALDKLGVEYTIEPHAAA